MTSYKKMRENMILGQFLPGLVKSDILIEVFSEVDRENFLSDENKPLAYSDVNLKISKNRYLVSPFSFAKILEAADIKKKDLVLLIGAGIGYETMILSKIAGTVISLEEDKNLFKTAEVNLKKYDLDNVINVNFSHQKGYIKHAPYDVIIILGAIDELNNNILNQLSDNGRLLACRTFNENLEESKLIIYYKHKNNYVERVLFDLNLPKLLSLKAEKNEFKLTS